MITRIYNSLTSTWWKGALTGLLAAAFFLYSLLGLLFENGLPVILNLMISTLAFVIVMIALSGALGGLNKLLKHIPVTFALAFLSVAGSLIILSIFLRLPDSVFFLGCLTLLILTSVASGALWLIIKNGYKSLPSSQKVGTVVIFFLWLFAISSGVLWLSNKGNVDLNTWDVSYTAPITPLSIQDPSTTGKFTAKQLTYGSGKNERRPEYGKGAVIVTKSVDASLLLPEWKGFKKKMREWYWGFGVKEFPLNGRVWYPEGDGQFPLVLIVHGNHGMEQFSDPGYDYLGALLASKGYIMVSVDENFVNATWSGDFVGKEMQTRAWLLLQHLNVWRNWNNDKSNQFYNKVDLDQIALIGHSRGGEAVAIAAAFNKLSYYPDDANLKFNFNFKIRSLVAIAPTDRRYTRRMELKNMNYLTLQGGYDSDEPSFFGMRQAERISYSSDQYYFSAGLYIPGGNHGQFNSTWKQDSGPPSSWMLTRSAMVSEEDQQQAAKVFIAAFLDATLKNKKEYLPLFENWRKGKNWLPEGDYLNRFYDNQVINIADYEEDIDLTTSSTNKAMISASNLNVWKEVELFYRDGKDKQGNSAAILGWISKKDLKSLYAISLHKDFTTAHPITESDQLTFDLSAGNIGDLKNPKADSTKSSEKEPEKTEVPEFSIVLTDSSGIESVVPASDVINVSPRWEIQYLKLKDESSSSFGALWEPTLASYQISLSYFKKRNLQFNVEALRKIELRFDRSEKGVIIIDKIGIRKRP